jgi:hypothetical protein
MNWRSSFGLLALGALLAAAGCLRLVTAPAREKRQEAAEAEFARLAAYTPPQIAAFMDDRLKASLGLSPAQQALVAALDLKYAGQLHETAVADDPIQSKFKALKGQEAAKEKELRLILSPDQFARYLQLRDEMKAALRSWAADPKP